MGGIEEQVAGVNKRSLSSNPKENGTMTSLSSDAVINLDMLTLSLSLSLSLCFGMFSNGRISKSYSNLI